MLQGMTYSKIVDFVKENTKDFDESHDYKHAEIVYRLAKRIMDSFGINYDQDLLMLAALLHDVRDHKYPKSVTIDQLRDFINDYLNHHPGNPSYVPDKADIILRIIDNVSYSREKDGKRETLDYPYNLYLDAISDADKIQALGKVGIRRCEVFTKARGGKVPEDVVNHCYEKLLRLYPEGFIRTKLGRDIAEPLHRGLYFVQACRTPVTEQ